VILGSGWGGFGLARSLNTKYYQPVIVTPRTYFVFTPLLAGTAVGTLEFRTAMESSHSLRGVEVVRGWGDSVDVANKSLLVDGGGGGGSDKFNVPYDKLVVAVGCYAQTFDIPGVKEHALFLKDVGDARRIRRRILDRFEDASLPSCTPARARELLHFAIVGGGPTGIEFAAELHDLLQDDLIRIYPGLVRDAARITVFDVAPAILGMFDEKLQKYARAVFARQGIRVQTSHHVLEVLPDAVVTEEEGRVPVGAVVWSTGLATNPFVKNALGRPFKPYPDDARAAEWEILKTPKSGQLVVDTRLRVLGAPIGNGDGSGNGHPVPLDDIFALGDCCAIAHQSLPATAQVADQQADWLARALNRAAASNTNAKRKSLADVDDQPEFKFRSLGIMAYLGGWRAITQSGGADVKGRMAWLLWRTAYLTKSVSWRNKLLIPTYW